jgi:hypothetical protein
VTFSGDIRDRADIAPFASAGVTRLLVRPWSRSSEAVEALRVFARDVIGLPSSARDG